MIPLRLSNSVRLDPRAEPVRGAEANLRGRAA